MYENILTAKLQKGNQMYKVKLLDQENPVWELADLVPDFLRKEYHKKYTKHGKRKRSNKRTLKYFKRA